MKPERRRRRSSTFEFDYKDIEDNSDDIYDILALSEDEYSEDSQDDIYDILALSDDEYSGDSEEYPVTDVTEGSSDFTEGIEDIDDATSAMAENVNQLLGIDDEFKESDNARMNVSRSKIVKSNSGEISGLQSCTSYELEVTAVYSNNATVQSPEKKFKTLCETENSCDQDEWKMNVELIGYMTW